MDVYVYMCAYLGTPSEILDHRLLATPFSFGPRMCLGGRLAELEIKTLFARLVQVILSLGCSVISVAFYYYMPYWLVYVSHVEDRFFNTPRL
jgi:hypothetical protein